MAGGCAVQHEQEGFLNHHHMTHDHEDVENNRILPNFLFTLASVNIEPTNNGMDEFILLNQNTMVNKNAPNKWCKKIPKGKKSAEGPGQIPP